MPEAVTTSRTGGLMMEGPGQQKAGSAGAGRGLRPPVGPPGPFHLLLVPPLSRQLGEPRDRGASVRLPCRCPDHMAEEGRRRRGGGRRCGASASGPLSGPDPAHSPHPDPAHSSSGPPTRFILVPPLLFLPRPPRDC